jgi:arylsulfatase
MFKHWVHEGGIASPLIAHWPAVITENGGLRDQPGHLIDIMATCAQVAGATYPESYGEKEIIPMEGVSLVPAFDDQVLERESLYWEHEGNRAIRTGNWKLVSTAYPENSFRHDSVEILEPSEWQLFDLEMDRAETHDLASSHPEKVNEMSARWLTWARRAKVFPKPGKLR